MQPTLVVVVVMVVAVTAGHCAAAGVRVQRAHGATDVRAVGQQAAARREGVAGRWREAAWDASARAADITAEAMAAGRAARGRQELLGGRHG